MGFLCSFAMKHVLFSTKWFLFKSDICCAVHFPCSQFLIPCFSILCFVEIPLPCVLELCVVRGGNVTPAPLTGGPGGRVTRRRVGCPPRPPPPYAGHQLSPCTHAPYAPYAPKLHIYARRPALRAHLKTHSGEKLDVLPTICWPQAQSCAHMHHESPTLLAAYMYICTMYIYVYIDSGALTPPCSGRNKILLKRKIDKIKI